MNEGSVQKLYLPALTSLRYPLSRVQHQMPDCTGMDRAFRQATYHIAESHRILSLLGPTGCFERSARETEAGGAGTGGHDVVAHPPLGRCFFLLTPFC